jgi:carboxypeptidase C (cathepsin A)
MSGVTALPSPDAQGDTTKALPEEKVAVTHHEMTLDGKKIPYTATTGLMHIRNEDEKKTAAIFYVAYVKDTEQERDDRPLTFCFNGGPGSCSVWLHLGAFGPKRIDMVDGVAPRPNLSKLVENESSLLDLTDLVFIDPVGTGFSRAGDHGKAQDFFGMEGDTDSMCRFIQCYLNQNHRWASPKFLAGESYGTTRAGAMASRLNEKGVALNGLILISLAINFQTFVFDLGNDLPYLMFLPTYAAVAWQHGRLADDIAPDLETLLTEVRSWCLDQYAPALLRGSSLDLKTKAQIAAQMARYTGMNASEIQTLNLRIEDMRFAKTVLDKPGYTVGRMDGRYMGSDVDKDHRRTQRDPSMDAPMGPYTGLINDHIRRTLAFDHESTYDVFNMKANEDWKWSRKGKLGYPDTSDDLRKAMVSNPYLKVLFANGIFDLATPFFGAEYTADHLALDADLRANITLTYYPAGHMMYFHRAAHAALKSDISDLFQQALGCESIASS